MNEAQNLRNKLAEKGIETLPSQCEEFIDLYEDTSYETYMELINMSTDEFEEVADELNISVEEAEELVETSLRLCEYKFKE